MRRWRPLSTRIMPRLKQHDEGECGTTTRGPGNRDDQPAKNRQSLRALTKMQLAGAVYNWLLCILLMLLLLSQLLTTVLSSSKFSNNLFYGRNPSAGPYAISGFNDEPHTNRVLVCNRRRRRFEVNSISAMLGNNVTLVEDISVTATHGYRVVSRPGEIINEETKRVYSKTCLLINATLEYIFSVCKELGYQHLARDNLRIVNGINSSSVYRIPNSLPVLIMPYWDNAVTARYAIPGRDGRACMFRLGGRYEVAEESAYLFAVNSSARESKTEELLGRSGGKWNHGWYEDIDGMSWYSDVVSTNPYNSDGIRSRRFDMIAMRELDCRNKSECAPQTTTNQWGSSLLMTYKAFWMNSIAISNGTRYGWFAYEANGIEIVTCVYDIASFISDLNIFMLILQWMLCMIAMHRGFFKGVTSWHNTDIGCLANAYSFGVLPITLLPRLKMIIAVFCTVGCDFEGNQRALSDAWFTIYPAIVNITLIHSSAINVIARIFRRRMTSWQIPVTIMVLSIMHYLRTRIALSNHFGFDGRIATKVLPDEFEAMTLLDVLNPSTGLRLGGDIKSLFYIKLFLFLLMTVPLLLSQDMNYNSKQSRKHLSCQSERALCVRACNIGGIGPCGMYDWGNHQDGPICCLNAYELVRLGYVIVGDVYLMTWENWMILATISPFRTIISWRNRRFLVFEVIKAGDTYKISPRSRMINLVDPKLQCINWWDIDARGFI